MIADKTSKKIGTSYPGVQYRIVKRLSDPRRTEKIFYIQYYYEGIRIQEVAGRQYVDHMTAAKANRIRAAILDKKRLPKKMQQARDREASLKTLRSLVEKYEESIDKNGVRNKDKVSWSSCKGHLKNYLYPFFGDQDMTHLVDADTGKLREFLQKEHSDKSPQTHRHIMQTLQKILRYSGIRLIFDMPIVQNETTEDLTPEQWSCYRELLEKEYKEGNDIAGMLLVIAGTGARQIEIRKLIWHDINFIRDTITFRNTKAGNDHTVPMNKPVRQILKTQWKKKKKSVFVFPGKHGRMKTSISRPARKLANKAGIPKDFRPCHGLRHFYGCELSAQGVSLHTIAAMLNHRDTRMTQRYSKVRDKQKQEASNIIAKIMGERG